MRSRRGEGILRGHSREVFFATTNLGKFREAARITSSYGINLKHLSLEKHEIQSNDLTEIASFAAREIAQSKRLPIITEDAGFFVKSLGGFPGPYSSYVFKTLGLQGILKLMSKNNQRQACFQAAVAFFQPKARPACFAGAVKGQVSERPRGTHGFGFDPIFIPDQGDGRTFGEMTIEEKNTMSHRAIALSKFSNWFLRAKRATPPYRGG